MKTRLLLLSLILILLLPGTNALGQGDLLNGSFNRPLALTVLGESTASGVPSQMAVLAPDASGAAALELTGQPGTFDRVIGWIDNESLLVLRYSFAETNDPQNNLRAVLFDPASGQDTPLSDGFTTSSQFAMTPDGQHVVNWPDFSPQSPTPLDVIDVYDAATMMLAASYQLGTQPGLGGILSPRLAGISNTHIFFKTEIPSDGFMAVELSSGTVSGPLDLLASGDGDETTGVVAVPPGGDALLAIGRPNPKGSDALFFAPLTDGLPPIADQSGVRPLAQLTPLETADGGAPVNLTWNHAGSAAAVQVAVASDFSASPVQIIAPEGGTPLLSAARAAFNSCMIFTPDDAWLIYVGEDRESLLALDMNDLQAPQLLLSGQPGLDLCDAAWPLGPESVVDRPAETPTAPATTPGSAIPIAVGDMLTGEISDTAPAQQYALDLEAGQVVTITMEQTPNSGLDPYLILFDPTGTEAQRNDDAFNQVGESFLNAQVAGYSASMTGTYTITATRFGEAGGISVGGYQISVTAGTPVVEQPTPVPTWTPVPAPTAAAGATQPVAGTLTVGSTVNGEISAAQPTQDYAISLEAGQTISVTMINLDGDLDCFVIIFDDKGNLMAYNDDSATVLAGNTFNSQIIAFTADLAGVYTIVATRYQQEEGTSSGHYELSVDTGTPVESQQGGEILIGGTVNGEISETVFAVDYTISLQTGDIITVTMERTGGMLDTYIGMLNADGVELAHNDDADTQVGDSPLNSQLVGFRAPLDGTYILRATRFQQANGSSTGTFQLSVTGTGSTSTSGANAGFGGLPGLRPTPTPGS